MRTTVTGSRKPHCRVGLKKAWGAKREEKKKEKKKKKKSWWYRFLRPHPLLLLTRLPKANNHKYYIDICFFKVCSIF